MVEFTRERSADGVTERLFEVTAGGERVPAVVWAPEGARGPRPLVLMGHGGSQHKKIGSLASRAKTYARKFGYATLAVDAPGHGDRVWTSWAPAGRWATGASPWARPSACLSWPPSRASPAPCSAWRA